MEKTMELFTGTRETLSSSANKTDPIMNRLRKSSGPDNDFLEVFKRTKHNGMDFLLNNCNNCSTKASLFLFISTFSFMITIDDRSTKAVRPYLREPWFISHYHMVETIIPPSDPLKSLLISQLFTLPNTASAA